MSARVPVQTLRELVLALFEAAGLSISHAQLCADAFLLQEMRGITTHGLRRLRANLQGLKRGALNPNAQPRVVQESAASVVLDADRAIGVVGCMAAMDQAVARAKEQGVGLAVVVNSNHFLGAAPYCLRAVDADTIGIAFSNSFASMSYPGSKSPVLGNGPFGYAVPTDAGFPLVYDAAMTTSNGKLNEWAREGLPIPDGFAALDSLGQLTSDPNAVLGGGATLPIGFHKGAGLTLLLEILTGVLGGSGFLHSGSSGDLALMESHSQCCIAIGIEHFMPVAELRRRMAAYVDEIKNAPRQEGQEEILLPGERAHRSVQLCLSQGVPLDDEVIEDLRESATRLGVTANL
jgi:LDH2 family malate/lactate/ureidoglycolate dehydrogenase